MAINPTEAERRECGASIRRIREGRGWTRRQLADESGVAESTIRDIETGSCPREGTMDRLLEALDIEFTSFGLMTPWMADQIGALITLAQQVPPERLPEAMGALMTVLGRAARGLSVPGLIPGATQIVLTQEANIDQNL